MYFHRQCSINHKNQEVESIYFLVDHELLKKMFCVYTQTNIVCEKEWNSCHFSNTDTRFDYLECEIYYFLKLQLLLLSK